MDSKCAIQLLEKLDIGEHHYAALVSRYKELLQRDIKLTHMYREGTTSFGIPRNRHGGC
ncbi:hypothetical protein LINPERHAP1_LOCUS20231 [Linum perenne]